MRTHSQKRFAGMAKATRTVILAVALGFGLSSGALPSQPFDRPGNVPLPPDSAEINKLINQEVKRLEEEEKPRWAWIAWIVTPCGALAVIYFLHAVRTFMKDAKAMKDVQTEQMRAKTPVR